MNNYNTRVTLLEKIKNQQDDASWEDFVHFYERFIYSIARKSQLSPEESQDLTQQVLLKLWKVLPDFTYDKENGGFRSWLYRITSNSLSDYVRKKKRETNKQEQLKNFDQQSIEDSILESNMDKEWQLHIAHLAMENLRKKFSGKAIDVFYALLEGKSISEVAEEFEIAENTVYVYKNRVSEKMLAETKYLTSQIG